MENLEARLDAQAGHLRAISEMLSALAVASPRIVAARAAVDIASAKQIALEEDELIGTPPAEAKARDETLTAYLGLLSARAQQPD
jgi:hypothetical protein